jgi:hypothetical protein
MKNHCIYSQDISSAIFHYDLTNPQHQFAKNVFTNADEFMKCVEKMAKNSVKIEGLKMRGRTDEKEYLMMKKLEELCIKEEYFLIKMKVYFLQLIAQLIIGMFNANFQALVKKNIHFLFTLAQL